MVKHSSNMDKKNIESIVPLLPMQQSFLWHSLSAKPSASVIQLSCSVKGTVDTDKMQIAWNNVVLQHQALRSSIHWKSIKTPLQLVHKHLYSPIKFIGKASESAINEYIQEDHNSPIDLSQAPAYRLAIFQLQKNQCRLIWSLSHVILDGWSCSLIINDWVAQYAALLDNSPLHSKPSAPLSDYTRWLKNQNQRVLKDYWNNYFNEHKPAHPTQPQASLSAPPLDADQSSIVSISAKLDSESFAKLQDRLRMSGIAIGALLQGILALAIRPQASDANVLYSMTVSGRHIELSNAEARTGMYINLMPISISFQSTARVVEWLNAIQTRFFASLPHSHASASEIQSCLGEQNSPYDTLLVLENQPTVSSHGTVQISGFKGGIISDIKNTLIAIPGDELSLEWRCHCTHGDKAQIGQTIELMMSLLIQIPDNLDKPLSFFEDFTLDKVSDSKDKVSNSKPNLIFPAIHTSTEKPTQDSSHDSHSSNLLPMRTLERVLTDIWCEVLNHEHVDMDASFFDMGGSSFQALQIFEKIEHRLAVRLPATTLFDAPTISTIATLIASDQPNSRWTSVVEVNRSGSKPPLFIPFEQLDMFMYRHLCKELGSDQPVYGLQITSVSPRDEESLLSLYHCVKRIQPEGPYLLAGLSGAGLVAWDIAQRFRKEGNQVAMLALLDTYGPAFPQLQPPLYRVTSIACYILGQMLLIIRHSFRLSVLAARSGWIRSRCNPTDQGDRTRFSAVQSAVSPTNQIKNLTYQSPPNLQYREQVKRDYSLSRQLVREVFKNKSKTTQWINHLTLTMTKWRFRSYSAQMAFVVYTQGLLLAHCREMLKKSGIDKSVRLALREGATPIGKNMPETQRQLDRYHDMYSTLEPYDGHILYCKAQRRPPGIIDCSLSGWDELLLSKPTLHPIPGDHASILKPPHVRKLAAVLSQDMAAAVQNLEKA